MKPADYYMQTCSKGAEIARDQKITELAYILPEYGIDYIVPVLYEWNLYNYEYIISFDDIYSRQNWIALTHLNELYTPQDMEIDNKILEKHELTVILPSKQDIMKYRIGIDDGESNND